MRHNIWENIYCSDGHHSEFLAAAARRSSLSHVNNDFWIQKIKIHNNSILVQIISQKTQRREKDQSTRNKKAQIFGATPFLWPS